MIKKQARVQVKRGDKALSAYSTLQLPSLLETGHLRADDQCLDAESGEWVPLEEFLSGFTVFSKRGTPLAAHAEPPAPSSGQRSHEIPVRRSAAWILAALAVAAAVGTALYAWTQHDEITSLRTRLAAAEETNQGWQQKYHALLFAAREVASQDMVRGRAILRNAKGNRIALPGIKVRIYTRSAVEAYLSDRHQAKSEGEGAGKTSLASHYVKNLPPPLETTSTDSDGRFEFKVPEPGEYVIQTSIRSAKSGEMRLWFVAFDSRDPLNTSVDITESNAVQQFHPLLMIVNGR